MTSIATSGNNNGRQISSAGKGIKMGNSRADAFYRPRVADDLLTSALRRVGAVQIVGPKWCGKTTTAEQQAKDVVYFQNPDKRDANLRVASEMPSLLLQGERPLLLDEWQDAPKIWDAVRFAVDQSKATGQFILTGSTVARSAEILHSGTGRFARLKMRPMSLYESGESDGSVSLLEVLSSGGGGATESGLEGLKGKSSLTLEDVAQLIVRGGWPQVAAGADNAASAGNAINVANVANAGSTFSVPNDSLLVPRDYVESIINTDISKVDNVEKNPNRVRLLMRSLARNESSEASMTTLQRDMVADGNQISTNTIAQYLNALRQLYVLEEQEAWAVAARSKVAMRSSPVRRYCDPSISCALLRMTPEKLLVDFNTFGLMFESLCIRDLRTYAEATDAGLFKYRDSRGLECDAIIEAADGTWGAVEIKLQESQVEKAAKTLLRMQEQVRSQHAGKLAFMMIITASGFAYQRDDGILIVPIGCLGP